MDKKNELQLLPGTKKRLGIKVPGENRFLYVGSAVLGAVLVATVIMSKYQVNLENQYKQLENQMKELDQRRNKNEEKSLLDLKNSISLITQVINNHTYTSKGLSTISSLIQNKVRFKSLAISASDNKVSIGGVASDFTTIAKQIAAFSSGEGVTDIELGKLKANSEGFIEFSMTIYTDKVKFLQK